MNERFERIIKGMQCCMRENNTNLCGACPYYDGRNSVFSCMLSLIRDAQFMIRQQRERIAELEAWKTARVLTLEEVKSKKTCWIEFEERVFPAIYCCPGNGKLFSVFIVNGGDTVFEDHEEELTDNEIWLENNFMDQLWRCWTSRPTEAQREAVKWDE